MKIGTKVETPTSTKIGKVVKFYPHTNEVDVKYKGSKGVDTLPVSMCKKA